MKEEQVEKLLYNTRDHIPVDESLKANLRKSFQKKRKPIWRNIWVYSAAVAAIIIFTLFQGQGENLQPQTVSASTFKITNALSFLNIGSGEVTAIAHQDGKLYVSTKNGSYLYEQDGLKEISKEAADDIFIEDENTQVFEQDGKIITLQNDEEIVIDNGAEPSVSKDGKYIAYIKEENGMKDVWVSDINGETKKKITTNPAPGLYNYMSPKWSSVDRGLFVMKQRNQDESGQIQIMKIDLGEEALDAKQTVSQFLQALIVRDDDYAKSFMEQAPEILTISNPHQTGYRILSSEEKDGLAIVKAEVTWSYTATAYSMISTYEFELASNENGYMITEVNELSSQELTLNAEEVVLNGKEALFSLSDVPTEKIQSTNNRISSLVLDQGGNQVIFTIQEMEDGTYQAVVDLFTFDLNSKTFTLLDKVNIAEGKKSIGISEMSIDESGKYLVLDVFLNEPPFSPSMLIYDLEQKKLISEFEQTTSHFWQGRYLLMQKMEDENLMMIHRFEPVSE